MPNILTISNNNAILDEISRYFTEYGLNHYLYRYVNDEETFNFIKENSFNAVIIDDDIPNYSVILKKLKSLDEPKNNIFTALMYTSDMQNGIDEDLTGFVDIFIQKPLVKNILIPMINSYLKVKKSLDKFREDNKELNKSLYQLDVLYNTSSKLSGNLDKEKLYEIMFETLEKTLSFDLACALMEQNNNEKARLMVHSLKKPDEELSNILKEKIILLSEENFSKGRPTEILTEEHIKPSYENQKYDIKLLNYDKLTAPIKVKERDFGTLLIYRKTPFLKEDVVCFQSIVHQISSTLNGITLYNEVKSTNIQLKKLERIKSEFVSIVSHELRTPLTPINNSLEIVLSEDISETTRNFTNIAKRNITRLSGIIEDLLDLSRMQTGKFDFKFKKYNIANSLDLILKTFEGQAKEKGMNFSVDFEDNLPEIYADTRRVEQILSNLVTNALKFTPNNGDIKISTKILEAKDIDQNVLISPSEALCNNFSGKYIKITVKDTGVGIKQEDIFKIFDKFSQIENSLTRNAGGVGLGLTISKHFIDAHLGGIWVESEENKGSSFNVIIPVFDPQKAYEIDLNAAKKLCDTVCTITLKSPDAKLNDFINKLKQENILKNLKNSKEILYQDDSGEEVYRTYFCNIQNGVYELMVTQIQNLIDSPDFTQYAIVLEKATYKKEEDCL